MQEIIRRIGLTAEILGYPYDDVDFSRVLDALMTRGFIRKYASSTGEEFGYIPSFTVHQVINNREKPSDLPDPLDCEEIMPEPSNGAACDASTTRQPRVNHASLTCTRGKERKGKEGKGNGTDLDSPPRVEISDSIQASCRSTWEAYSKSYFARYNTEPVRNQKINSQVKQFVERLGSEAPLVAEFYVTHNDNFYVRKLHEFGLLLANAENLRTQWAVGWAQMTAGKARQIENTSNSLSAVDEALAIYEGMQNAGNN